MRFAPENFGTEYDLELELVGHPARFDRNEPELCVQATRAYSPNQFGQDSDAKDGLIHNAIARGTVQRDMTHLTSAQHGAAQHSRWHGTSRSLP